MNKPTMQPVHTVYVQGSGKKPYEVKIYEPGHGAYCPCPAWRFQKDTPAEYRVCKHVQKAIQQLAAGTAVTELSEPDLTGTKSATDLHKMLDGE